MAEVDQDAPDGDLLRAWRDGNELAGNRLVRRHFAMLYRFFRPRAGPAAADLIQKTFLACVERLDALPDDEGFRPFMVGIARNQLLMHLRKERRRSRAMDRVSGGDHESSPSGIVAHRQEQRMLLRALRKLPPDTQLLLELFYWEQMSMQEIGQVLDAPTTTIKTRLFRARQQLRDEMAALGPPSGDTTVREIEDWARKLRERVELEPE